MERRKHPKALRLPALRRPGHRRMASSSSESSRASPVSPPSHGSDDQFLFSPLGTPKKESPLSRVMSSMHATDSSAAGHSLFVGKEVNTGPCKSETTPRTATYLGISPNCKSTPIAIEPAAGRNAGSTSTPNSIPPAPLSARGDIPGGYFPLHEDPRSRIRAPHPFREDAEMARKKSVQRAAESSKSGTDARQLRPTNAPDLSQLPLTDATSMPSTTSTPISSYTPSGLHDDVVLPIGKYYPSNWERRQGKSAQNRPSTMAQATAPVIRSEPQVPKYHGQQWHARTGSDAKRRLQQYQRDMVAQAAMAASALLASSTSTASSMAAPSLGGTHLPGCLFPANFPKTHKPAAPKLRPIGSPGPVTPISLDGDCYLSLGSSVREDADRRPADSMDGVSTGKGKQSQKDTHSSPGHAASV